MFRALVMLLALTACEARRPEVTLGLTITHIGTGAVMGASGEYEVGFSPGWVRVSEPLFVPGELAEERLKVLATEGDALSYIGTDGAPFPENLATTYSDAPLLRGHDFTTRFEVGRGDLLSFGCMFGPSNDTIVGVIAFPVFDGAQPFQGDVSDRLAFYDVGVELNEEPGFGAHQPGRGTGGTPEQLPVTRIDGTDAQGHAYPDLSKLLRVEVEWMKKL